MTDPEQSQGNNQQVNDAEHEHSSNRHSYNPISIIISLIKWYRNLDDIGKFSLWMAVFTGLLFTATVVQIRAYIESERAFWSSKILTL